MSQSLRPYGLQQTRLPCPSLSPWVCSNPWSLSWWSHPLSHHPLILLPSIFPRIRAFSNDSALHIMWPKCWSLSFSINSSNEYSGLMDMFLLSKGLSRVFSKPQFENISSSVLNLLYGPFLTSVHDYWKTIDLTTWTFSAKWCLCFLICYLGLS